MKESLKYRLNYFIYQAGVMFFPYIALYLKDAGYNSIQYGAVMSFTPIVIAFTLPFCGLLDKSGKGGKLLAAIFSFVMITAEWLIIGFDTLTAIVTAVFFASAAKAALATSLDNIATVYCIDTGHEFSKLRSFASFGYIAANLAGAFLYDSLGFRAILIISSVSMLLFAAGRFGVKRSVSDFKYTKKEPDYRLLLKNKAFLLFLAYQIFCFAMLTFNNHYDIIYQKVRELPSYIFGITTMIRVGFEILTFMFLTKTKISYKRMLVAAPVFLIIQSAAYFFWIPTFFIYFLMSFAGIGSGLIIFANNKYLNKIVRPRNITAALYISAVVQNIFTGLATFIGGAAIDIYGIRYLYLGSGILLSAAFLITVLFIKNEKDFSGSVLLR
ncbi:MAG: MFS transporter [Clostridiales bacterium]|jgi:predicted MFS family arabinose efflux permease|nr:MFS transporter [Clostridiales bacterium]